MKKYKIKNIPQANNGLMVEGNQFRPLSQDTLLLGGKPHSEGGVNISYFGNQVEAEVGETLSRNQNGDMIVFGNMQIPSTNTKFKNAVKEIGKEEFKAEKQSIKANDLVALNDPYNRYERLGFNTGMVLESAANMRKEEAKNQKEQLGTLQEMMLQTAERLNIDPKDLNKALNGKRVPMNPKVKEIAREGKTLAERNNNPGNLRFNNQKGAVKGDKGFAKFNSYEEGLAALMNDLKAKQTGKTRTGLNPNSTLQDLINVYAPAADNNNPTQYAGTVAQRLGIPVNTPIGQIQTDRLAQEITRFEDTAYADKMGVPQSTPQSTSPPVTPYTPQTIDIRRRDYIEPLDTNTGVFVQPNLQADYFNPETGGFQADPPEYMTREIPNRPINTNRAAPSPRTPLNPLDFIGEAAAIFDRPDYVQLQQYNPQLLQPYQISLQDQINQNQSSFNALRQQFTNNPQALATLAGQNYAANQQVLGNQFRTNQQIANQIGNQNVQTLNDAQLRNIQLADTQYVRQEQGRANTEQNRLNALNSFSDKVNANNRFNNNRNLLENMFNYRPDENLQLQYQGPDAQFNWNGAIQPIQPQTAEEAKLATQMSKTEAAKTKAEQEKQRLQRQTVNSLFSRR